jgi:hypothetical protein
MAHDLGQYMGLKSYDFNLIYFFINEVIYILLIIVN